MFYSNSSEVFTRTVVVVVVEAKNIIDILVLVEVDELSVKDIDLINVLGGDYGNTLSAEDFVLEPGVQDSQVILVIVPVGAFGRDHGIAKDINQVFSSTLVVVEGDLGEVTVVVEVHGEVLVSVEDNDVVRDTTIVQVPVEVDVPVLVLNRVVDTVVVFDFVEVLDFVVIPEVAIHVMVGKVGDIMFVNRFFPFQ